MIRLYGHQKGESSFVQVTRGMRFAAKSAGLLAGEVDLDRPDDERVEPGADAAVALHCGAPLGVVVGHQSGVHRRHWLLLAPNSEGIPPFWRQRLRAPTRSGGIERPLLDGFLAPSAWAADVLKREFPEHMVLVAPHGVHPEVHCPSVDDYAMRCAEYQDGVFKVVHFTSSLGQRKCTRELLRAWKSLENELPPGARLLVVSNPLGVNEYQWQAHQLKLSPQAADVVANPSASQAALAAALRHAHVVCQPSRAEGFGLLPLEARACGVPVVMTKCTGHGEHWAPDGVVTVPHGNLAPLDDYPGAMAPTVEMEAIRDALLCAYQTWSSLAEVAMYSADDVRDVWSWEKRNAPVLQALVDEAG